MQRRDNWADGERFVLKARIPFRNRPDLSEGNCQDCNAPSVIHVESTVLSCRQGWRLQISVLAKACPRLLKRHRVRMD